MATKGQELKKELTQAFSGLKFSVKTKMVCKGNITEIVVTVKGLKDSDYTIVEIKEITNKYHNWDWRTVTGDTNVIVNTGPIDTIANLITQKSDRHKYQKV